jgi:hypothetical protein
MRLSKALDCSVGWLLGSEAASAKEASKGARKAPGWVNGIAEELSGLKRPSDQKAVQVAVKALVKALSHK